MHPNYRLGMAEVHGKIATLARKTGKKIGK